MNPGRVNGANDGPVVAGPEEGEQKPVDKLLFNNRKAEYDNKSGMNNNLMMEIVADGNRSLVSD